MLSELRNDKFYYIGLIFIIIICTYLNYDANLMSGILPYYYDYKDYFKNGLRFNKPFSSNIYTWPMWGYGLVLLIGNKLKIIIFQQLISFITIVIIRDQLRILIDNIKFKITSALILFSFPWFFFHTSLWPYSISANLFTISILYLGLGIYNNDYGKIIISAICYGIMLNFRSDYYFLSLILFTYFLFVAIRKKSKRRFIFSLLWSAIILTFLIPWFFYTKTFTKTGSFVSSNSGHVLFISLGQLPNNIWKISVSDNDSVMYSIVKSKVGPIESSLSYKSDIVLRSEFKRRILKNPIEFIKKCIYNLIGCVIQPFYVGDFHNNLKNSKEFVLIKNEFKANNFISTFSLLIKHWQASYLISIFLYLIGISIFIIFISSVIFYILHFNLKCKIDHLSVLIILSFAYQISLNTLAYSLPIYTTNIFILCILFIGINFPIKESKFLLK